jgi:hypothetical protein
MNTHLPLSLESAPMPERIITHWRRFASGLWRLPEGDIQAAYCADTFPKLKVFTHDRRVFANCGGYFSGPVLAEANCYPLIPVDIYSGPEPKQFSYEGRVASFQGREFKLGPKVVFAATDATVAEWQQLLRTLYADGGWFARQDTYQEFLDTDPYNEKSENAREASRLELAGEFGRFSKADMKCWLDGKSRSAACAVSNQLGLAL